MVHTDYNGYLSVWKNSISDILAWVNQRNEDLTIPGRTYEIVQIIPNPSEHEHWIGIVKVTTPAADPDGFNEDLYERVSIKEEAERERIRQIAEGEIQEDDSIEHSEDLFKATDPGEFSDH